jgi:hypothetical protein
MSDEERIKAFRNAANAFTRANTASPQAARSLLVREGIATPTGNLTKRYGGTKRHKEPQTTVKA